VKEREEAEEEEEKEEEEIREEGFPLRIQTVSVSSTDLLLVAAAAAVVVVCRLSRRGRMKVSEPHLLPPPLHSLVGEGGGLRTMKDLLRRMGRAR